MHIKYVTCVQLLLATVLIDSFNHKFVYNIIDMFFINIYTSNICLTH